MGQRSQIYVRFESIGENAEPILIANYYQWNYGERMISRVKHILEYIATSYEEFYKDTDRFHNWYESEETQMKIRRMLDVNFDMQSIVMSHDIIEEYKEYGDDCKFNDFVFYGQDNNDGQAYLYVMNDGTIKYAFTDYECTEILSPEGYMKEYSEHLQKNELEAWELCKENMKYIREHAQLMTNAEWAGFLDDDYSSLYKEKSTAAQKAEFNMAIFWGEYRKSKKSYKGIAYKDLLADISDDEASAIIRNHAKYANNYNPDIGTEKEFVDNVLNRLIDEKFEIDVNDEIKLNNGYLGIHTRFSSSFTSAKGDSTVLLTKLLKNTSVSKLNRLNIADKNECEPVLEINKNGDVIVKIKLHGDKFGSYNGKYVTVNFKPYDEHNLLDMADKYAEKYLGGALIKKKY